MNILSAIIALAVSGILLFRAVIKPRSPHFDISDRISARGILYDVGVLSKCCATTERGSGIDGRKLAAKIGNVFKAVEKRTESGKSLSAPLALAVSQKQKVIDACLHAVRALRKSYLLGHADGRPRIFAFCDLLVANTRGEISRELLFDAVREFDKAAPIVFSEAVALPSMLEFCVCGLIATVAESMLARAAAFERGEKDGAENSVDLDMLHDDDYICGLFESVSDMNVLEKLAMYNGVDIEKADVDRRKATAEYTAVMRSCLNTLDLIENLSTADIIDFSAANRVFCGNTEYARADTQTKAACLEETERRAKRRKSLDLTVAHEICDAASALNVGAVEYIFARARSTKSEVLRLAAACAASVIATVIAAVSIHRGYLLIAAFLAIFFASADTIIFGIRETLESRRMFAVPTVRDKPKYSIAARNVFAALVPCAQIATIAVGAVFSSAELFAIAMFPQMIEIGLSVSFSVANASYKPLVGVLAAVKRFATLPSRAVSAFFALCSDASKTAKRTRSILNIISRAAQFVSGVTVITLSALFDSFVGIAVGAAFSVAAFSDEKLYRSARVLALGIFGKIKSKKPIISSVPVGSETGEVAYFDGDSRYSVNLVDNARVFAVFDSRGGVGLFRDGKERASLNFTLSFGDTEIALADCDGVRERHRTTYRAISDDIEFSAELIVPIDLDGCVCRATVINRTDGTVRAEMHSECRTVCRDGAIEENVFNGTCIVDGDGAIGSFAIGPGAFCKNDGNKMDINVPIAIERFAKKTVVFATIFDRDGAAVARAARMSCDENFFERAELSARVFAELGPLRDTALAERLVRDEFDVDPNIGKPFLPTVVGGKTEMCEKLKNFGIDYNYVMCDGEFAFCDGVQVNAARAREIAVNGALCEQSAELYVPQSIGARCVPKLSTVRTDEFVFEPDYELKTVFGGITVDGKTVVDLRGGHCLASYVLSDGKMLFRDGRFFTDICRDAVAACGVAIGSHGKVLAANVCDGCNIAEICADGVTEFVDSTNGVETHVSLYAARGKGGVVFDISVFDRSETARTVDVMFYTRVGIARPLKFGDVKNGIYVTGRANGKGFVMLSALPVVERSPYRDGYYRRGGVDRTRGFGNGKTEIAPALTVELETQVGRSSRAVFCIAAVNGISHIDEIGISTADAMLAREKSFLDRNLPIRLHTTDKKLDRLYAKSFYHALTDGYLRHNLYGTFCGIERLAAEFYDPDDVKRRLISDCRIAADGEADIAELLILVIAIKYHIDRANDARLLSCTVDESGNTSVADCCDFAVQTALKHKPTNPNLFEFLLLRAALRAACEYIGRNIYFGALSELKMNTVLYPQDDGCAAVIAQAVAAFECDDDGTGAELLAQAKEMLFDRVSAERIRLFGKDRIIEESELYAFFFATVTKYSIGVSYRNGKIEFYPHTAAISPHTEFDIVRRNDRRDTVRVVIADGETRGEWRMKRGKITYSTNRIDVDEEIDEPIILYRSGHSAV